MLVFKCLKTGVNRGENRLLSSYCKQCCYNGIDFDAVQSLKGKYIAYCCPQSLPASFVFQVFFGYANSECSCEGARLHSLV